MLGPARKTNKRRKGQKYSAVCYKWCGYFIRPKWIQVIGQQVRKGWIVTFEDGNNAMPGDTWFDTLRDARDAINLLLRARYSPQFLEACAVKCPALHRLLLRREEELVEVVRKRRKA